MNLLDLVRETEMLKLDFDNPEQAREAATKLRQDAHNQKCARELKIQASFCSVRVTLAKVEVSV